jgi:hypothetical protein
MNDREVGVEVDWSMDREDLRIPDVSWRTLAAAYSGR